MVRLIAGLYARIRHLVPELAKFGVVGGTGAVIDLGGAAVLHSAYHQGPLKAKAISIAAATVVTYVGSRFWTFRHRENQPLLREGTLFVVLNIIGLAIAELVIAFTTYAIGLKGPVSYNLASLAGTGLGTIFRYFAYRKWVFLAPAAQPAPAAEPDFAALPPWTAEPAYPEPVYAEPVYAEPAYPEPAYPEPAYPEPAYPDPAYTEPAYMAAPPLAFAPHSARSAPVAADPGQAPSWLDQPPPWSRQPAAQAAPAARTAQATMTPPRPRSSGGRHRKPRSA